MSDPNILTPLPSDGQHPRGPRLEIDEFVADNEMTNLFLIALWTMQQGSLTTSNGKPNWMNYYGIAGIHGQPNEKWDGISKPTDDDGFLGYCHHSLETFPTWHRPYMYLFELAVYQEMAKQAEKYPNSSDKTTYKVAAARFRLPYWDIVMPRNLLQQNARPDTVWGCPLILKAKQVTVKLPKPTANAVNGWDIIQNPLYSFVFPTDQQFKQAPDRARLNMPSTTYNTVHTSRIPTSNGDTNDANVDLAIQRQAAARATLIWQMLNPNLVEQDLTHSGAASAVEINQKRSWESFATRAHDNVEVINGLQYTAASLESWHDGIHVLVGTGSWWDPTKTIKDDPKAPISVQNKSNMSGQMGKPAWAAFDPIFFLHHCNIDRLLSIYQALYSDKYVNHHDIDNQLLPFLTGGKDSECWKSSDSFIKDYWNAGFGVPGNTKPATTVDTTAIRATLTKYLSDTYYWATNGVQQREALPNWPKNLSASWALHGRPTAPVVPPTFKLTALKIDDGVPELFSRAVELSDSAQQPLQIHDEAIEAPKVVELSQAVNFLLPAGAFEDPVSTDGPSIQITWNAHVKVRKYAFNGSFSVHLFIGWVKDNQPERYMTKKNEAGFTGVFANDAENIEHCANCASQRDEDIMVNDVVPLTTIMYDYLDAKDGSESLIRDGEMKTIPNLTPESVEPFLKEHLQWRIIDLGTNLLSGQEQQAGLEITVSSRQFTPPTANNLMGVYGPETVYPNITNTKAGGFGYVYPTAT